MRTVTLLAFALLTLPAAAAETPWQEIAPGVRLRLISSDVLKANGTTMVALELDMPQGTKTYWRVPGESGITTEIDTAGSSGIAGHEIVWPYPLIEVADGLTDFVYRGPTVLPVELKLDGERGNLKASVVMGVCSDICVPAMASFNLPLDFLKPDRGQGLRIAQAVALTPQHWSDPRPLLGQVKWDAAANAISVGMADPRVDPLSLIADASAQGQLFGAPQKSPDGSAVLLPLLGGAETAALQGKPVNLTFMTEMGPFSLSTTVGTGSTAGMP
jgi:DsbC/DsbD-like thiol-disulfide interchange protein